MSAVAGTLSFEVLRFASAPVSAEVAVLDLEGRFRTGVRRRLGVPRLVAESAEGSRELAPAAAGEAVAEPEGALWRASYAVALELLEDGTFSLAVGRELLLELPPPDAADGIGDREVRLAREANALRRTADEARAAAAAALDSVAVERRAREAAETTATEARLARDDLSRRAAALDDELAQARRDHAAELVRGDEEREAALATRDAEATRIADERVAVVESEAAEARRGLKAARAELEAIRRDLERERERAQAAAAALPRGRVTELAGEPVPGEAVTARRTRRIGRHAETVAAGDPDAALAAARAEAEAALRGDEPTEIVDTAPLHEPRADPPTQPLDGQAPEPRTGDPGESVRVLGARRSRRMGEGPPAEPAPGTAAIGARHIEPGQAPRHSAAAAWLARLLAVAALAVVVVALLLVLRGL